MKGISRSPVRRNGGCQRYLKPGALAAQIRNSKFNAKPNSPLIRSIQYRVYPASPSPDSLIAHTPPAQPQTLTIDQIPYLLSKVYGPCSIRRKKLSPARPVLPMTMNLNPSLNSTLESTGGNTIIVNNDVL